MDHLLCVSNLKLEGNMGNQMDGYRRVKRDKRMICKWYRGRIDGWIFKPIGNKYTVVGK